MAGKKSSGVKFGSVLDKYSDFIMLASDPREKPKMKIGPMSLNMAIGDVEGIPMGRFVQFVGRQSSGKSTLALDTISTYQREHPDEKVLYIDYERSFDQIYAASCGVDLERTLLVLPLTTEAGLNVLQAAVEEDLVKLVIIDSVPAAMPASEVEKTYDDNVRMSGTASIITRFCQRSVGLLDNKNATVILINQFRRNMSTMSREEEVPMGGMALQYASSLTIYLARIKTEDTRQTVQAIVKKNKVGNPQSRVEFFIDYGYGINHAQDILTLAEQCGLVQKGGAWYTYKDMRAQGAAKASEMFPIEEIQASILENYAKS